MPHTLFLGSRLATQDRITEDSDTDLPKSSGSSSPPRMTLWQRILRSIRSTFGWKKLFNISRSDDPNVPLNVLTHADWENNELSFVKSHIYHSMIDMSSTLMTVAIIINAM